MLVRPGDSFLVVKCEPAPAAELGNASVPSNASENTNSDTASESEQSTSGQQADNCTLEDNLNLVLLNQQRLQAGVDKMIANLDKDMKWITDILNIFIKEFNKQ